MIGNRFKFNGQQLDPVTQQYYLRARFYNPVVARFTQEDTYRGDGLNLYAYCDNRPTYYVDPTGHVADCVKDAYKKLRAENPNMSATEAYARVNGYYQDKNGRWHRPNGQFSSNKEVGIFKQNKPKKPHGNSLLDPRTNYGYALVDRDTKEILKFGETIHPNTRYTQHYLDENNAIMKILNEGGKKEIHDWQKDMNKYYKWKYGEYPPLNINGN